MLDEIALKNALKFATIYGIRNPSTCHSTHYIYQKYNEPNILLLFFFETFCKVILSIAIVLLLIYEECTCKRTFLPWKLDLHILHSWDKSNIKSKYSL